MCDRYTRFGCTFRIPGFVAYVDHFRNTGSYIAVEMDTVDFRIKSAYMDTEDFDFIHELETGISSILSLLS